MIMRAKFVNESLLRESFYVKQIPKGEEGSYSGAGYTRDSSGRNKDFAGNFEHGINRHTYELFFLDSFDKNLVKDVPLKSDEIIYRYETDTTRAGKMSPLVKINIQKGLAYFLTDKSMDEDILDFDKRGVKLRYLNLVQK